MQFDLVVKGEFENVKGLLLNQSYFIKLKCGTCNTVHEKDVFISINETIKHEIKEHPHEYEIYTMGIECRNCKENMLLTLEEPTDKIKTTYFEKESFETKEEYIYPVTKNNTFCHISTIVSHSAVIVDANGFLIDIFNMQEIRFNNVEISKKIIAESNNEVPESYILNCQIKIEQVK